MITRPYLSFKTKYKKNRSPSILKFKGSKVPFFFFWPRGRDMATLSSHRRHLDKVQPQRHTYPYLGPEVKKPNTKVTFYCSTLKIVRKESFRIFQIFGLGNDIWPLFNHYQQELISYSTFQFMILLMLRMVSTISRSEPSKMLQ